MLVSVCGHQISLNITIWSLYVGSCERSDLCESPSNSAICSTADKVRQRNGKLWPVEAPSAFRHITNMLLETLAQSLLSLTRLQSHLVRNSLRSRWLYNSLSVCSAFKTDFKSSAQYRLQTPSQQTRLCLDGCHHLSSFKILDQTGAGTQVRTFEKCPTNF